MQVVDRGQDLFQQAKALQEDAAELQDCMAVVLATHRQAVLSIRHSVEESRVARGVAPSESGRIARTPADLVVDRIAA